MLLKKIILFGLAMLATQVVASTLPFGFEVGIKSSDINYSEVTVQSLRSYCPSVTTPLIGKSIKFSDSNGFFDFNTLDFDRLRNDSELSRFLEVPASSYRNAKQHLIDYYKGSESYSSDIKLAKKFSASNEFQSALKEIPDSVSVVQKVYSVNGAKICAGFINDKLWTISFTPHSTNKFDVISRDIKKKYNSKGLLSKWYVDCEVFNFSDDKNCVVVSNSVNIQPGVSVAYLLKAPKAKGFGIFDEEERQYDGLSISRENQEMVIYADWEFEKSHWDLSKIQWQRFINRYTESFRTIYQNEQLRLRNDESKFLEQF
ncbi:hypothetical protein QTO01_16410 [Vibrio mytili]|uniref:hypothetical protein n=1 Tax=Vibrio mytili TaxID=50718 RepID=UPI002F3E4D92